MFSFLNTEDYQTLLRDTYRKAKSSDRLGIVFGLIRQYPGDDGRRRRGPLPRAGRGGGGARHGGSARRSTRRTRGTATSPAPPSTPMPDSRPVCSGSSPRENRGRQTGLSCRSRSGPGTGPETPSAGGGGRRQTPLLHAGRRELSTRSSTCSASAVRLPGWILAVLDGMEKDSGSALDLEKKRLQLVRQARVPDASFPPCANRSASSRRKPAFRQELRKELEKQGRYHEAIVVLQGLVELEPEQAETSRRSAGRLDPPGSSAQGPRGPG